MGAMDMPYLKEFYFAEKGKGAFLNGKRLKVSKNNNLGKSFILTDLALRYDFHNKQKVLRKLKGKVYDVRMLGCAVAAYAYVARGFADAYYTTFTNSWDVAAGALIVEESGGKVTDLKGGKWNAEMGNYVSSNGKIHNAFLKTIK